VNQKIPFFFFALFLSVLLLVLIFMPYVSVILLAMVFAAFMYPVYKRVLRFVKGGRTAASFLVVVMFTTIVLIPLIIIGTYVISEASVWMDDIPRYFDRPPAGIKRIFHYTNNYLHLSEKAIRQLVMSQVSHLESFIIGISAVFMTNTIKIAAGILVFLMSMFCFLRDGPAMIRFLLRTVPLPGYQTVKIMKKLRDVSRSVVRGMLLNSLAVAFISFPGFYFTGLPVFLWCLAVATGIMIPIIGSITVWTSAVIVLLLTSGLKPALFIACYGAVVIGVCDNMLGPYLMKGSEGISPIWILFSVLGGIQMIGVPGIVIGPVIFAAAMSFTEVYREEYTSGV
jgi:predicted PurR-regulated permease PerM